MNEGLPQTALSAAGPMTSVPDSFFVASVVAAFLWLVLHTNSLCLAHPICHPAQMCRKFICAIPRSRPPVIREKKDAQFGSQVGRGRGRAVVRPRDPTLVVPRISPGKNTRGWQSFRKILRLSSSLTPIDGVGYRLSCVGHKKA